MSVLTLICQRCRQPIHPGTGCLYVLHADLNRAAHDIAFEARWNVAHYSHPEVLKVSAYAIGASEFQEWAHVARWTAHLMEKAWFTLTDWDELMRELSGESRPARIRVAGRAAA